MTHGPKAISSVELRRSLFTIPSLEVPEDLDNSDLDTIIERKTALALHHLGATSLPAEGSISRGKLDDAVHGLAFNEIRRRLRPEDPDVLRELNAEDRGIMQSLEALKEQAPGHRSAWGGGIVGGT